jgi:hypothetical protein
MSFEFCIVHKLNMSTYESMPVEDHFRNMVMAMVANMSVKAPKPFASPKKIFDEEAVRPEMHVMTGCTDREEIVSI